MNSALLPIFFTGLTSGGLTCLAMQGGLLASVIANQKKLVSKPGFDELDWQPVLMFLGAKLVAHTALGFLLGLAGSALQLSEGVLLFTQLLSALFMLATAGNLLEWHPIFRYVAFQPPKFMQRYIRSTSKSGALFAPAMLGFLTVFIPCGVTQAMEVMAITAANPFFSAAIMFTFVLGTMPLFATVGMATSRLSEQWSTLFSKVAAGILIFLSVLSINGILLVLNSPITLQKITEPLTYFFSSERFEQSAAPAVNGVQQLSIQVTNNGYSPRYLKAKAGVPVQLTLTSKDAYSCAVAFRLKEFGISTFLNPSDTQSFSFTPTKPGKYTYTCSMGMYSGVLEVI